MADLIGHRGALTVNGVPIAELYVDQGDGTFARKVTTTDGAGVVGYVGALTVGGVPIAVRFVEQGDGTYAELVSSAA